MTSAELADRIGIGGTTLRSWTRLFGEFLSSSATPESGKRRQYTQDDERILSFVHEKKRRERVSDEDITEQLRNGEADSYVPNHWREVVENEMVRELVNVVRQQLEMLQEEKEYLREQLKTEREARISAEKLAARYKELATSVGTLATDG